MLGKYFAIEGIDGAGKSEHVQHLARWMNQKSIKVNVVKEPSTGSIGRFARHLLKHQIHIGQKPFALLFAADTLHQQEKSNGIVSMLARNEVVLSDRSLLSTFAYQLPECNIDWLFKLHEYCIRPHLTLYLDISVEDALGRIRQAKRANIDLFEKREELERVWEQYKVVIERFVNDGDALVSIPVEFNSPFDEVQASLRKHIVDFAAGSTHDTSK